MTGVLSDPATINPNLDSSAGLHAISRLPAHVDAKRAYYVIVAMPYKSAVDLHHLLQYHCNGFRHILLIPDMPGVCSLGVSAREIRGDLGFEVPQRLFHRSASMLKRALDVMLSVLGLIFLCPVFLLISLAIKLSSSGPVFFGHQRYGRDGKLFRAIKFRTMAVNGDEILREHFRKHPEELSAWQRDHKLKRDPRVTSVGQLLR